LNELICCFGCFVVILQEIAEDVNVRLEDFKTEQIHVMTRNKNTSTQSTSYQIVHCNDFGILILVVYRFIQGQK